MKRLWITAVCTAAATMMFGISAFAGQWNLSPYGWWYDRGDGTYAPNGWHWIDGNNDGIEECYYFNESGYCIPWSYTPDGYWLDGNGAWVVDGVIQIRLAASTGTNTAETNTTNTTNTANTTNTTNTTANNTAETEEVSENEAILGTYSGTYNISQGKAGADITLFEEDGNLMAEIIFYNTEEDGDIKDGSYLCTVKKNSDDEYELRPDRWLNHPSGYSMLTWKVTITNKRMEGVATSNKKYTFRCRRK